MPQKFFSSSGCEYGESKGGSEPIRRGATRARRRLLPSVVAGSRRMLGVEKACCVCVCCVVDDGVVWVVGGAGPG